ncbi:MAG: DUF4902 domain-containing protein [Cellvibrionales bacterium]|nr:DUF4902 domain-containing protein [Cellvibrionales bacterium]
MSSHNLFDLLPRIEVDDLANLDFKHLDTVLDESCFENRISGYTEWICDSDQVLSIGWHWYLDAMAGKIAYRMDGLPYSNMWIMKSSTQAYTEQESLKKLSDIIATWDWEKQIELYTKKNYAHHL